MTDKAGIKEDVDKLKEWYSKQHHLPQNIAEHYFYNFVCGTNSLEKAKRKIDAYFSLRKKCLDLLTGVYPHTQTYRNMLKAHYSAILPTKTPEGYRVMIKSGLPVDSGLYNVEAYFVRQLCLLEMAYEKWPTDLEYIIISSYQDVPLSVVKSLDMKRALALSRFFNEGLPVKLKADYIMNAPNFILKMEPLLRSLISKKLNERFHFTREWKIKEILPASMVPAEFGGEGQSLKELSDYWTEQMESRTGWFEEKLKLFTDESKRGKDSAWKGDLDFGFEGSFKTLSFD